jgi:transposase-like protein
VPLSPNRKCENVWTLPAGEVRNVSLLVVIGVNEGGYREILGICEGANAG